ncbi:hypothetical protein GW17_00020325 [Ensete ventricosum]|nr:hypothetical protein GW17_00020325 [Ensete ventricosum]
MELVHESPSPGGVIEEEEGLLRSTSDASVREQPPTPRFPPTTTRRGHDSVTDSHMHPPRRANDGGLQFRPIPPGTGGTYRSIRLPVHGPPATGRFRQKSIVGSRLKKKSIVDDRLRKKKWKKKRKRRKKEEEKKEYLARASSSPARCRRPRVARAHGRDCFFSRVRRRSDKHKEKKRKKEKKDKEKKEGKERKDTDRSKDKHKEKDRKEKHKDKKRKNKDESRILYDRADKQTESPHGDLLGECSRKTEETKTSKFAEKLERKIEDEEKMAANRKAENFSGPVQKSIGNLAAATAMVKERVAGDKIVPPTMGALQRRIDGFERPTDKFTFPTQRKNEALDSANAVQKERSASDKLVPKLASTGQKGNGHTKSPVEYPVGSVHKRFEGPYAATAVEIDNQNSKKVVSSSNSDVPRTINGTGQPAQSFSACKNLNAIGLATKMEDGGRANKILQNHILTEQRRVVGLDQAMARDASNKIEEGKAKSKGRDADDRKEERHRDRVRDEKKIKDKDEHKGKKKEKAKVKEKGEQKDKELKDPRDGRKKDQLDSLDVKTLAPQTDKAESYLTDETLKKRKEIGTNGFSNGKSSNVSIPL